jgi:hypothetical protein
VLVFTLAVTSRPASHSAAPLIHVRASKLHDTLKTAAGRTTGGIAANHFRSAGDGGLALALVLLIRSGLMVSVHKIFGR